MPTPISGIHHVTAIASDPQRNVDFYTEVLGLRLVKQTVNFGDPDTYHLYFGDEVGTPGTIITFFPWLSARPGRNGAGMIAATTFSVPESALEYWEERLRKSGTAAEKISSRFEEHVLSFCDPDGMTLEIAGHADAQAPRLWRGAPVPPEHAIRGLCSVSLCERGTESTADMLFLMGFRKIAESGNRSRFELHDGGAGARVDLLRLPQAAEGIMGPGAVHHVAFRVRDDAAQLEWRQFLVEKGVNVTPVRNRLYFHSIYFNEPGGVLFELATDPPGFTIDESVESLGGMFKLPPWLESRRGQLEASLPAIHSPANRA